MGDCAWGCLRFAEGDSDCQALGFGAMALRYAWMGYRVMPLAAGGKRPHQMLGSSGGYRHATLRPEVIRDWWTLDKSANIGVATGSVSRLAVVDLDLKDGRNGTVSFTQFLNETGYSLGGWSVPCAETPSGGYHYWLRVPEGVKVPERPGILSGVDVKGDGGHVAAWPSAVERVVGDRSGGTSGSVAVPYRWAWRCPHEAPLAPGWLLPWLESAVSSGTYNPGKRDGADSQDVTEGPLERGSRNRDMYRLACSLYRRIGTDPQAAAEVLQRLRIVWQQTDRDGFPWSEVLTCAESARRFVEADKAAIDRMVQDMWRSRGGRD